VVIGFDALEQPEVSRIRPLPVSVAEKCVAHADQSRYRGGSRSGRSTDRGWL